MARVCPTQAVYQLTTTKGKGKLLPWQEMTIRLGFGYGRWRKTTSFIIPLSMHICAPGIVQAGELVLESNVFGIHLLEGQGYGSDAAVEALGGRKLSEDCTRGVNLLFHGG